MLYTQGQLGVARENYRTRQGDMGDCPQMVRIEGRRPTSAARALRDGEPIEIGFDLKDVEVAKAQHRRLPTTLGSYGLPITERGSCCRFARRAPT